jgi:dTDP-4-dehydrorhamnose reductase
VENMIATEKPDVVIHTAAMTQVDDCETQREACWLQNVEATRYIALACEAYKVFLLHLFFFDYFFESEFNSHYINC